MRKGNSSKFLRHLSFVQQENFLAKKEAIIKKLDDIFSKKCSHLGYDGDIANALDEIGVTQEEFFNVCLLFLEKSTRTKEETRLIYGYLFFMKDFITMIKKQDESHYSEYLQIIATYMNYEKLDCNRVLMRFGDKGKKAYIMLNGEIDILIKSPKVMKVYEKDYLVYLATLIRYREYGLVNVVVNENFNVYPLEIEDDLYKQTPSSTHVNNEEHKSFFSLTVKNKSLKELKKTRKLRASYLLSLLNFTYVKMSSVTSNGKKSEKDILNNVSTEEYIQRLNVIKDRSDTTKTNRYVLIELTIYNYTKIISRTTGALFGELALSDPLALRTATIITASDCHFGTLSKQSYSLSLKAGAERQLRQSLNFICSFELFKGIVPGILKKRYFNNFSLQKVTKGSVVIEQNTPATCISLLREGNYDIYVNMSIFELLQLEKYYYSKTQSGRSFLEEIEKSEREYNTIMKDNFKFRKFYTTKEVIRIREIQCPDLIGLFDFTDANGNNTFTVECKSPEGEIFQLSLSFYNAMKNKDETVRKNELTFIEKKYDVVSKRLTTIRTSKIQSFFDYKSKRDIFDFDIENEIVSSMMKTISLKRKFDSKKTLMDTKDLKLSFNKKHIHNNTSITTEHSIRRFNKLLLSKNKVKLNSSLNNNETVITTTTTSEPFHMSNRLHRRVSTTTSSNTQFSNEFLSLRLNTNIKNNLKYLNTSLYNNSNVSKIRNKSNSFSSQKSSQNICFNDMIWENVNPKVQLPLLIKEMNLPEKENHSKSTSFNKAKCTLIKLKKKVKKPLDRIPFKVDKVSIEKYNELKRLRYSQMRNDNITKTTLRINCFFGWNSFGKNMKYKPSKTIQ